MEMVNLLIIFSMDVFATDMRRFFMIVFFSIIFFSTSETSGLKPYEHAIFCWIAQFSMYVRCVPYATAKESHFRCNETGGCHPHTASPKFTVTLNIKLFIPARDCNKQVLVAKFIFIP